MQHKILSIRSYHDLLKSNLKKLLIRRVMHVLCDIGSAQVLLETSLYINTIIDIVINIDFNYHIYSINYYTY